MGRKSQRLNLMPRRANMMFLASQPKITPRPAPRPALNFKLRHNLFIFMSLVDYIFDFYSNYSAWRVFAATRSVGGCPSTAWMKGLRRDVGLILMSIPSLPGG